MNIDQFIASLGASGPSSTFLDAAGWRIEHPDEDRSLEEIDLVFLDDLGRTFRVRIGGGIVRPADRGPDPAPVSSLATYEFAEDLAASLGCRLVLWEPEE